LNPRQVKIPGILVDCVVVAEKPEYHMQTFGEPYSAAFAGEMRVPASSIAAMAMSERKIIARRAALELKPNSVVNLGIGMPEGVSHVAAEERIIDLLTLTAEPGVVFVGTFTCGGLVVGVEDGKLRILQEGKARKFVPEVEHRTFSGAYAWKRKQSVTYITERCVFRLGEQGLELTEIAPGIDLERDIFAQMDFRPVVSKHLRTMDDAIFRDAPMGLRDRMLAIP